MENTVYWMIIIHAHLNKLLFNILPIRSGVCNYITLKLLLKGGNTSAKYFDKENQKIPDILFNYKKMGSASVISFWIFTIPCYSPHLLFVNNYYMFYVIIWLPVLLIINNIIILTPTDVTKLPQKKNFVRYISTKQNLKK